MSGGAAGSGLLRLYPPAWRRRYEPEMRAVLDDAALGLGGRLDLLRGALDAWLHPPHRSRAPGLLALAGGVTWALVALDVLAQPAPPDWPGYLAEGLPLAIVAVLLLAGAVGGAWLRLGEGTGRIGILAIDIAVAGHIAWLIALMAAAAGVDYGPTTALAQTVAAGGTLLLGLLGLRVGELPLGFALVAAGTGLVVPSAWGWLLTGVAWLVVAALELRDDARPVGPRALTG